MVTFTETTFHELLDSDKTTPSTLLDSDGKLKQSLHNVLKSTDFLDTDEWSHNNVTVTESGTSPSGKKAYLVTETTASGQRSVSEPSATHNYTNRYSCASVDVKRGTGSRHCVVRVFQSGGTVDYAINLDDGTATRTGAGTLDSCIVTELSDGWFNVKIYYQNTNDGFGFTILLAEDAVGDINYTGDGTSSIYVSRPRVYEASVHVPVERVDNGDFASDSDWNKQAAWSISGGTLSGDASLVSAGSFSSVDQSGVKVVPGETYRFEHTISNITNVQEGDYRYVITGFPANTDLVSVNTVTANGTYVETFTVPAGANIATVRVRFAFTTSHDADESMDIDDVSLTKVINDGIQNDLDGEDFIETSGSAIYHGGLEYNADGSFRGIQSFESRTNTALRSSTIGVGVWSTTWGSGVTATLNSIVSPSGELDATKIDTTDGAGDGSQSTISGLTIDNYYTVSVFVKNDDANRTDVIFYNNSANESINVTWSGSDISSVTLIGSNTSNARYEDYGDGWYRVSFTVQVKATSGSFVLIPENDGSNTTGSAYFWGAQFEAGKSVSPYVPTTNSSTRSRGGDKLHKPLSEFGYNHDEVTVKVEFETAGTDGDDYPRAFQFGAIDDTQNVERSGVYYDRIGGDLVSVNRTNNTNTSYLNLGTGPTNQLVKVMAAYKKDDFATSDDGDTVATDTTGDLATVDTLFLGNQRLADSLLNGYIKKLIIWPKRLANATLEAESE